MLAFMFAVVSLSSIAPDPIVTPAAAIHDRIAASTSFAGSSALGSSGLTSDITVAPACTFGVPRFGRSLWNDTASLARFTQPECAGIGPSALWLPANGSRLVRLEPMPLRFAATGSTTKSYTAPLPVRLWALAPIISGVARSSAVTARAGTQPIFARLPAGTPRIAERRH